MDLFTTIRPADHPGGRKWTCSQPSGQQATLEDENGPVRSHQASRTPRRTEIHGHLASRPPWKTNLPGLDTNIGRCWGGLPGKSISYKNGNLSPSPIGHFGGINYRDDGYSNILVLFTEMFGRYTEQLPPTPREMGGGDIPGNNPVITLCDSPAEYSAHSALSQHLRGVPGGQCP